MRRLLPQFAFTLFALIGCNPIAGRLEEAKEDAALMKAEQLLMAAKAHMVKHEEPLTSLDQLKAFVDGGEEAFTDPWGQRYQFRYVELGKDERARLVIWTTHPKSGKVFAAPREMADRVK